MTELKNYRIKKVTKGNGKSRYYPQKKILWFWMNIGFTEGYEVYDNEYWAQVRIFEDYNNSQKDNVEYILPDESH